MSAPLLEVNNLKVHFPIRSGVFLKAQGYCKAVDDVSLYVAEGETLGLVGESGCGKTTLGRTAAKLIKPTAGSIRFDNKTLTNCSERKFRPHRRNLQMIFQDPMESLNAQHTVGNILEEPLVIHKIGTHQSRQKKLLEALDQVGLSQNSLKRFPFEFSGGQRQRIGIARALMLNPKLIICDEPVSALDVSIQGQVLNLLLDLQQTRKLSYLFIAHNLAVVKHMADRIAVMYLGKIVESAPAEKLYISPKHPYTRALIDAIPTADPRKRKQRVLLQGTPPSPIDPPSGCPFHTRCPYAREICKKEIPLLRNTASAGAKEHTVSCHFDL